ncbi:ANTAR domain-containing protein [Mycobacterium sp. IDR2000157661]|uniref:ANTAR domain-containing protein n=1 Tax=Mycobacterium sp. IDR2000157661 TaxID=2867005 RepID=UPI001EED6A6B|nr:ANTAR domain-containing protein [Mycobacterium sp. IDR2000157661]ULE34644.1 ANTAR domain-containing protein [Mycobacterium sp. IDR2000157661]
MMYGRRGLDTAEGVLIALRHCSADEAFHEIIGVSHRHQVPVFTLAEALVNAAAGCRGYDETSAGRAVMIEWGALLGASSTAAAG